jgi:hypothetical protein
MRTILKSTALQFALVAMVLRALLPAGWMPVASGASDGPLAICTLHGPAHLSPAGKSANHEPAARFCPFATAAHMAGPALAPPAPLPAATAIFARKAEWRRIHFAQVPRRTNEARAPPAFA